MSSNIEEVIISSLIHVQGEHVQKEEGHGVGIVALMSHYCGCHKIE